MAQYFFVQNADENECFYSGIRVVNISDEMQIQPQSRLILAEPTVIAENQMQYVYQQRPNTQQVAQPQQTQYVLQEDDIVTDSFTSHQIYVSTDGSANIQRQLQHTGLVQQSPEPQAQQVIIQQPQTNRVILQSSPTQPVIVHQPTVQAQNPVVLNNRAPQQSPMQQQQRIIYDSTRQPPVYTITTPQPQMQAQPRPMQQNIIVRQQAPQMQRQQIRMQQPTLTYQRAQTPTTVIQNRATVAQTRASLSQPRHTTTTPVRHRYRAPTTVTTPRAQVAAPRVTRPVRYASVTTPQQPRPPRVLNSGLIRMSQPEQRQASFSGSIPTTTRMLTPLGKVNRTYPNIQQKPQTAVATQPSTTSKLEVRNIVPTSQSSNDPNGDLEESITASILEKSQITVNHTEESTTSDEQFSSQESTYSSVSNGSSIDLKQRKVMKAGEAVRGGRGRGQVAQRPAVKRPVNQSVQDLFNSMSTDVEQTNQQQQQQQQMLLTQSSPECETRESAKMLVILQCGEQRLITFTLPKESCTVQELLEQVGVPFTPDTNIQCVSNPGANIDYVVTVGDPVQDNVSNEIVMRTENNVEQLQQQFQQPVQQQQQQQQIQQQQQQPTMQPPLQQQQQRSPIRPQQGQFVTSTPISQRQQSFGAATQQPQLTPIKAAPPPTPEPPPEPPKPPAVERKIIQGWLALCSNCGFCGIDHAKCERCHHILGDTYKRIPCSQPKPTPTTQSAPIRTQIPALALPTQSKIQKQFVRIAKEPIAMQKKVELVPKRPVPELTRTISSSSSLSNNSMNSSATSSTTSAVPKNTTMPVLKVTESSSAAKARTAAVRNRTRATKTEEPIILTLSSDDEEETPKPKPKPKKSVSTKTEEIKALACEPAIPEMESPIKGNERLCITDLTDVPDKLLTSIQCRTIRIGTLHYEPKEQVIFSSRGVRIIAPNVRNAKENIILDVQIKEIVKIIAHFGKMLPILFIYTSPSCAEYIRNSLDMASNASKGPYFDPCTHKHEAVRRITILAEVITDETKSVIKSLYSVTELEEISYKDASELYKRSTMKIDQMANTSSASADEGGSGNSDDVHQILIYPQGKGGISINTEDYKCLAIDQYLNDVIIDFYLNYLRLSVFTEEQRDKTHIFSSFFYKRLTAMSTRQRQMEKDLKMTASQKRHHRVKGWTKSVNLFDKEFIIIPINEQSHWFLAIICFPGLKGPQTYDGGIPVKVAPTPKKRASKDGERKVSVTIGNTTITPLTKKEEAIFLNDDSASERDEAEADESDMESEESEPEVEPGHQAIKQPCILIFDSLAGGYRSRVVATLRDYLTCEYKAKVCPTSVHTFNKTNMPGHTVKVPQQNNFTDCGLYLLQYVEEFFSNPIRDYRLPVKQIQNWFTTLAVTKKREDISNLLKDLVKEMHPERLDLLPDITFPTQDGKLIETEENFEEAAEFEEEELDDPNYEMDDEDLTEEESPEKKNGKKLLKRSFEKTDKSSPDKKIARTN